MRLFLLLCAAGLVNTALAAAFGGSAVYVSLGRRALDGILDGLNEKDGPATREHTEPGVVQSTTRAPDDSGLKSFLGFATVSSELSATKTKTKEISTTPLATGTSYSVIGTLPPIQTPSATFPSFTSATPSGPVTVMSSSTSQPAAASAHASSGTSEWKIIGVAVIAFTTVAGILLLSVFFDQWWRFVRDLFWRRRKKETEEELVPDWEKAEWHLRFGRDRQRYPSFGSLPSVAKVQPPPAAVLGSARNGQAETTRGQQLGHSMHPIDHSPATNHDESADRVGLGLGRVGSVRKETSSAEEGTAGQLPLLATEKVVRAQVRKNPFDDDARSVMPDDVYGGVMN
ncbi:hypothetical protein BD414DRAFT_577365 [Trametes punicea]|nr:hypothetical protein BD414DRAFT_577365 [Trametes punicea]